MLRWLFGKKGEQAPDSAEVPEVEPPPSEPPSEELADEFPEVFLGDEFRQTWTTFLKMPPEFEAWPDLQMATQIVSYLPDFAGRRLNFDPSNELDLLALLILTGVTAEALARVRDVPSSGFRDEAEAMVAGYWCDPERWARDRNRLLRGAHLTGGRFMFAADDSPLAQYNTQLADCLTAPSGDTLGAVCVLLRNLRAYLEEADDPFHLQSSSPAEAPVEAADTPFEMSIRAAFRTLDIDLPRSFGTPFVVDATGHLFAEVSDAADIADWGAASLPAANFFALHAADRFGTGGGIPLYRTAYRALNAVIGGEAPAVEAARMRCMPAFQAQREQRTPLFVAWQTAFQSWVGDPSAESLQVLAAYLRNLFDDMEARGDGVLPTELPPARSSTTSPA